MKNNFVAPEELIYLYITDTVYFLSFPLQPPATLATRILSINMSSDLHYYFIFTPFPLMIILSCFKDISKLLRIPVEIK